MKQNKNIPEGYKDSPLGIIPNEWEVKRLENICSTFKSGQGITSKNITTQGFYPVYGGNGLRGYTNTYTHKGKYILIGRQGALCGNINFVNGENYISEHAIAVQTNKENNIDFWKYKLEALNLNKYSESSAQPGLSVEKLLRLKVSTPTLIEQKNIASILFIWDEAIEKQTALIEKLEVRKRGLMHQLLTGKKRLPGFNKKWNKVKIEDVFYPLPSFSYSRDQLTNKPETIHCIHYGDIHVETDRCIVDLTNNTLPFIKKDIWNHQKYKNDIFLKEGDLIIADASEDYEGVGKSWEIVDTNNQLIISGLHTIALRPVAELFHTGFTCYLFRSITLLKKLREKAQGTKVYSLSFNNIKNISFSIPSIKEQIAIKEILLSCDKEIVINRRKLQNIKDEKKGLMQVLLTGKKRV